MKIFFYIILSIILLPSLSYAGAFNSLPPTARTAGFGGAFTAAEGEVSCLDFNPAGLAAVRSLRMAFSSRDYHSLGLLKHSHAAAATPVGRKTGFAFSFDRVGTTGEVEFLDYSEERYSLGFGSDINAIPGLKAGAAFTFYRVVSDINASAYGISGGILWNHPNLEELNAGFSIRNINTPELTWTSGASDDLAAPVSFALQYSHFSGLTGALSIGEGLRIGCEYALLENIFSLRAGYRSIQNYDGAISGGLSASVGSFSVDYAAENHSTLGLSHFFTINANIESIRM